MAHTGMPRLLPIPTPSNGRLLVVLDLDQTLIHSIAIPATQPPLKGCSFVVSNQEIKDAGFPYAPDQRCVWIRPGCAEFLQGLASIEADERPDVIVWTLGHFAVAEKILSRVDPKGHIQALIATDGVSTIYGSKRSASKDHGKDASSEDHKRDRMHTRFVPSRSWPQTLQSQLKSTTTTCNAPNLVKDLALLGYDLKRVILVDDNPHVAMFHPQNLLLVRAFQACAPDSTQPHAQSHAQPTHSDLGDEKKLGATESTTSGPSGPDDTASVLTSLVLPMLKRFVPRDVDVCFQLSQNGVCKHLLDTAFRDNRLQYVQMLQEHASWVEQMLYGNISSQPLVGAVGESKQINGSNNGSDGSTAMMLDNPVDDDDDDWWMDAAIQQAALVAQQGEWSEEDEDMDSNGTTRNGRVGDVDEDDEDDLAPLTLRRCSFGRAARDIDRSSS